MSSKPEWREREPLRHLSPADFQDEPPVAGWRTILLVAITLGGLGALLTLTLLRVSA